MHKRIIFFDFDGVMVQSFDMALAIAQRDHLGMTADVYRTWFMGNVYKICSTDTDEDIPILNDPSMVAYFEIYEKGLMDLPCVPGMQTLVVRLAQENTLVMVSSCLNPILHKYLSRSHLDTFFSDIMGADTHRSKVRKIKMACEKYGVAPEQCYFITDTAGDVHEAHEAGVPSIAVTWGHHQRALLEQALPQVIANSVDDIYTQLL